MAVSPDLLNALSGPRQRSQPDEASALAIGGANLSHHSQHDTDTTTRVYFGAGFHEILTTTQAFGHACSLSPALVQCAK
jgi:hypothetical protein